MLIEDRAQSVQLIIDTGPGVVAALGRSHRDASPICHVLLSHCHGDHISGFAYFVWQRHYERLGKEPAGDLFVYGLDNTLGLAKTMVAACYAETPFAFKVFYETISDHQELSLSGLRVRIFRTDHTTPSVGCVVSSDGKELIYTSDTLPVAGLELVSNEPSILFHEGMWTEQYRELANRVKHSTARDAAVAAVAVNAQQLVLMHISPNCLGNEGGLLREAAEVYRGPVSIPFDGSVYLV